MSASGGMVLLVKRRKPEESRGEHRREFSLRTTEWETPGDVRGNTKRRGEPPHAQLEKELQ